MEPRGGRHIYLHIGMVRLMKPPEEADPVICAVHPVIPDVKDRDGYENLAPAGEPEHVSQAEGMCAAVSDRRIEKGKKQQIKNDCVEKAHAEVKERAEGLLLAGPYKRMTGLKIKHRGED